MPWDDELEELTLRVELHLGGEALGAAAARAEQRGRAEVQRLRDRALPIPYGVFAEALRMELRQLLQPN